MMQPFALALLACAFSGAAAAQTPLIETYDKAAIAKAAADLHFKASDVFKPAAEYRGLNGEMLRAAPPSPELINTLVISRPDGMNFRSTPADCLTTNGRLVCDSIVFSSTTKLPEGFNGATFAEVINNKLPIKLLVKGNQLDCQLRILLRGGVSLANLSANMKEFAEAAATLKEDK